jgi:hypothetical protein
MTITGTSGSKEKLDPGNLSSHLCSQLYIDHI